MKAPAVGLVTSLYCAHLPSVSVIISHHDRPSDYIYITLGRYISIPLYCFSLFLVLVPYDDCFSFPDLLFNSSFLTTSIQLFFVLPLDLRPDRRSTVSKVGKDVLRDEIQTNPNKLDKQKAKEFRNTARSAGSGLCLVTFRQRRAKVTVALL